MGKGIGDINLVRCSCCGVTIQETKCCPECGAFLQEALPVASRENATERSRGNMPASSTKNDTALSDEGLTLLVNTCKKTVATVGGNGYSEIVLYKQEDTGAYWLHTYEKYEYMTEEEHASYQATPELASQVLSYIEENGLATWINNHEFGFCGADYVIRFKHGDEVIRLDSSKMPDNLCAYATINEMLYSSATEEMRRYAHPSI